MKIFFIIRRYVYGIIIGTFLTIPVFFYPNFSYADNNKMMQEMTISIDFLRDFNPYQDDISMTLSIIRELHNEVDNVSHWFDSDLLMHVVTSLVEMYRKVVEVTLLYYVEPEGLTQKEFHEAVIKIISHDIANIIDYLCKEFVHSIFNENLSWQERICHCAWILSIILIIKTSIEEMPYSFNFEPVKRKIKNKISEITLCLKAKIDISER